MIQRAVGLPNLNEYADPALLIHLAQTAEKAGWDGCFIWDHLAYRDPPTPAADPQVVLGAIAATTTRIRFGALLTPLARRRPTKVARETVTLDHLSKGRLIFGAALGWSGTEEFEDLGEPGDARIRADKLDEALQVITALWTGERVDHEGEHYTVRDTQFLPGPAHPLPIWIGGVWPAKRPFRRAARHDGVFPLLRGQRDTETMSPEALRTIVAYTRTHGHPRDVIIEGNSDGDRAPLNAYTDLTWYIEKLGWWRGTAAETEAAIKRGPPSR